MQSRKGIVEHERQPSKLVVRIVDREPVAQPFRRDGPGALRHPVDRRQRAAGKRIAAEPGQADAERKAKHENQQEVPKVLPHRGFRSGDLENDRHPSHRRATAENAKHDRLRRHGDNAIIGLKGQALAIRDRLTNRHVGAKHQPAGPIPHLEPRAVQFEASGPFEPRQRAVRPLLGHLRGPLQIAVQPIVERPGDIAAHEGEHDRGVEGEDDQHRLNVPERQRHTHAAPRPQPLHGASSQSMKPMPRTVWINFTAWSRSIFLRSLAIWTSITLLSVVERCRFTPDIPGQHLSRDDLAFRTHEVIEQFKFSRGQVDRPAGARNSSAEAVYPQISDADGRVGCDPAAPQQRPDPGDNLCEREGLGQVVVRAAVQACHPPVDRVTSRQHQHGRGCCPAGEGR